VPIALAGGAGRTDGLREDASFFAAVTQVREALHGGQDAAGAPRGVDAR